MRGAIPSRGTKILAKNQTQQRCPRRSILIVLYHSTHWTRAIVAAAFLVRMPLPVLLNGQNGRKLASGTNPFAIEQKAYWHRYANGRNTSEQCPRPVDSQTVEHVSRKSADMVSMDTSLGLLHFTVEKCNQTAHAEKCSPH